MRIGRLLNNLGEQAKLSKNAKKEQAIINKNIRKVSRMLGDCFYTEAEKLGGGAFEVRAFRPVSDYFSSSQLQGMSAYTVAQKALTREAVPSCVVKYDPTKGLETTIRGIDEASDVFYRVTQKIGEEPVMDESVLENVNPNLLEKVKKCFDEIKGAIGRYIPTLDSIKQPK